MRFRSRPTLLLTVLALTIAHPALAGPPLLCHPFDIGDARSLPWSGARSWFEGLPGYKTAAVLDDITALLTPSMPVIVRMETVRRAVIYASADPTVATALVERLVGRARTSEASGHVDALAFLDAAYAVEALREITELRGMPEFRNQAAALAKVAPNADAYALIGKALGARPDDAGLHFAAALIAAGKNPRAYAEHRARAAAGTSRDPLLARNIHHVS